MMGASEEFLRAGNSAQQTSKLLEASTVMSKIAGQTQEESAQSMIAIMNSFKMNADDMMTVVDKMVAIDNTSATSTRELSAAIKDTAQSAQLAGSSFDAIISYIGTVSSVSRKSADTIGNAFFVGGIAA
jgi:TP901 family phage tail tape measure protein